MTSATPIWESGEPANLAAAAEDAYEWLAWFQPTARLDSEQMARLERCMAAMRKFLGREDE